MKILFILFFFNFNYINAATVEYKEFEDAPSALNYDVVQLYRGNSSTIVKPLEFFKDKKMNLRILKIDTLGIEKNDKKLIAFNSFSKCINAENCSGMVDNYEFIRFTSNSIVLKIDGYEDDLAYVKYGKSKLYFKISYENFYDGFKTFNWHGYIFPGEKTYKLDTLINKDNELKLFFKELANCGQARDLNCLSKLAANAVDVKNQVLTRAIYENKKLCDKYLKDLNESEGVSSIPDESKLNSKSDSFWNSFNKALLMNTNDSVIIFKISDFNKSNILYIRNRIPLNLKCENQEDLTLEIIKIDNKWKIKELTAYVQKV